MQLTGLNAYRLFCPAQASGAGAIYFDLWNHADSGLDLIVLAVIPVVSGAVAVSGTLAVDLFLEKTTAIGTGGTAATREGTDPTACTITNMVAPKSQDLNGSVTARLTPSGGATAGAVISSVSVFTEETSAASYMASLNEMVRRGVPDIPPLIIGKGAGIRVVQGSVASVGNTGFDVCFLTRPR